MRDRTNLLGGGTLDAVGITAPPIGLTIVKSASVFTQVTVNNYGLFLPAPGTYDGSQVRYRPHRDNGSAIANNEFLLAKNGVTPLPASGSWWININTNIAAGSYSGVLYDFPSLECMIAMMGALANADSGASLVPAAPAAATVTGATTQIVAANTSRRYVSIGNTGTTDGTTATGSFLYLGFGAAAVVGSGTILTPGQSLIFQIASGITTGVINGISTAGNIKVSVQEMN